MRQSILILYPDKEYIMKITGYLYISSKTQAMAPIFTASSGNETNARQCKRYFKSDIPAMYGYNEYEFQGKKESFPHHICYFPSLKSPKRVVTFSVRSLSFDWMTVSSLFISAQSYYSQLSLSRLRLSRITAYLEKKIWSLL